MTGPTGYAISRLGRLQGPDRVELQGSSRFWAVVEVEAGRGR